jgi:hypothetical protein
MNGERGRIGLAARREGGRRPVSIVFAFVGIVVLSFAQAAERGLIDGFRFGWPIYAVGIGLIVVGIFGMGRATEPDETESGDRRESDGASGERGRADELRATLERMRGNRPGGDR